MTTPDSKNIMDVSEINKIAQEVLDLVVKKVLDYEKSPIRKVTLVTMILFYATELSSLVAGASFADFRKNRDTQ